MPYKNFSLPVAFFMIDSTITPDKCWSIKTPKYFNEETGWTTGEIHVGLPLAFYSIPSNSDSKKTAGWASDLLGEPQIHCRFRRTTDLCRDQRDVCYGLKG